MQFFVLHIYDSVLMDGIQYFNRGHHSKYWMPFIMTPSKIGKHKLSTFVLYLSAMDCLKVKTPYIIRLE